MDHAEWRPRALGLRTDLALLLAQGSRTEPHPLGLVVRSPQNPGYHWGNALIVDGERLGDDVRRRLPHLVTAFLEAVPDAEHVAIAIDAPELAPRDLADSDPPADLPAGVAIERDSVLRTDRLTPTSPPPEVELRPFALDDDTAWAAAVDLEMTDSPDTPGHRAFTERRLEGLRGLQESELGAWWGAWTPSGEVVAMLGIYAAGDGLGRYQNVMTREDHRRRGIAGALVRAAGAWALARPDITALVIVADPEGPAIGVYRGAGFQPVHDQWALYRAPAETDSTSGDATPS